MNMESNRRGPWSAADKEYIAENHRSKSAKDIAAYLKRNEEAVSKYIKSHYATSFHESAKNAEYNIQASPVWKDIEKQFSRAELEMFLYQWGRIISQFKDDVYPTEEMQVIDTIKLDILMNRSLTEQQKNMREIQALEALINIERDKQKEDQDRDLLFNMEKQVAVLRAAQESLNTDYRDMLNRKGNILKEMKATRDARIKVLESSKHSIMSWFRRLLEDRNLRLQLGLQMEKMRIATEVELNRLTEFHKYEDGMVDQPFLTPDNVIGENNV